MGDRINPNSRRFFNASSRQMRMETLKDVGYIDGHSVIPSKKDKQNDAKRQRKQKPWMKDYEL